LGIDYFSLSTDSGSFSRLIAVGIGPTRCATLLWDLLQKLYRLKFWNNDKAYIIANIFKRELPEESSVLELHNTIHNTIYNYNPN